jgi:hypothetical protein
LTVYSVRDGFFCYRPGRESYEFIETMAVYGRKSRILSMKKTEAETYDQRSDKNGIGRKKPGRRAGAGGYG